MPISEGFSWNHFLFIRHWEVCRNITVLSCNIELWLKNHSDFSNSIAIYKVNCKQSSVIWKVTFQINFMLRNWSYTSSSWLDRLQISDRKFVNHTTEMILWSMILIWWVFLKLVFRSRGSNIIDAIASPFGRGSTKSNFLLVLSLDQDFAKELFLSNAIWVMYFIEK